MQAMTAGASIHGDRRGMEKSMSFYAPSHSSPSRINLGDYQMFVWGGGDTIPFPQPHLPIPALGPKATTWDLFQGSSMLLGEQGLWQEECPRQERARVNMTWKEGTRRPQLPLSQRLLPRSHSHASAVCPKATLSRTEHP